jgi:hypothetical protein
LHAGLEHWKVEYGELKKSTKFLRISESDTFFRFAIFLFSVLQSSMQSESTIFIQALHRSSQHLVRSDPLCMVDWIN